MRSFIPKVIGGRYLVATVLQETDNAVAQCYVSHVPHMKSLVRVWLRVFYHDSLFVGGTWCKESVLYNGSNDLAAEERAQMKQ